MVDIKNLKSGESVVVMINNVPREVKVVAVDRLDRFKNNLREEHTHIYVEGIERRVEPEELFDSLDNCVKSLLPKSSGNSQESTKQKS